MTKVLNIGSLNYDKVYRVERFVQAKETISAQSFETFTGGKGLNQSVALGRAGVAACHAGAVGQDGEALISVLQDSGVDTSLICHRTDVPSGHAVIQIEPDGQNCIIVCGGANVSLSPDDIGRMLGPFSPGDILLLQNETSGIPRAMEKAHEKGMRIAFNPSPVTPDLFGYPLKWVDYLILNETEGHALTGEADFHRILDALTALYPGMAVVLTLGEKGVLYQNAKTSLSCGAFDVKAVDTTAAGDTFCGYFIGMLSQGKPALDCLTIASKAAALAISRAGAAPSIPTMEETLRAELSWKSSV